MNTPLEPTFSFASIDFCCQVGSIGCKSSHSGFLDVSRSNGGLRISDWIGQLSCLIIFSTSLSVASVAGFLRGVGGSILASIGGEMWDRECQRAHCKQATPCIELIYSVKHFAYWHRNKWCYSINQYAIKQTFKTRKKCVLVFNVLFK